MLENKKIIADFESDEIIGQVNWYWKSKETLWMEIGLVIFNENYDEMVVIRDIEIFSLCEHHLLPFIGKAHVAYIPNGYITGLSKIARVVEAFARRLQVQERLTTDILNCIQDTLQPSGVAVVIEAQHMCMQMRGIKAVNSDTIIS